MKSKVVQVCHGRKCQSRFSPYILTRLQKDSEFYGYTNIELTSCLCRGRCEEGPVVEFDGHIEIRQNPIKASEILKKKVAEWKKLFDS